MQLDQSHAPIADLGSILTELWRALRVLQGLQQLVLAVQAPMIVSDVLQASTLQMGDLFVLNVMLDGMQSHQDQAVVFPVRQVDFRARSAQLPIGVNCARNQPLLRLEQARASTVLLENTSPQEGLAHRQIAEYALRDNSCQLVA